MANMCDPDDEDDDDEHEDDDQNEDEDDDEDADDEDEEAEELDRGYPDYDGRGEPEYIDRDNEPPDSENPWKKSP